MPIPGLTPTRTLPPVDTNNVHQPDAGSVGAKPAALSRHPVAVEHAGSITPKSVTVNETVNAQNTLLAQRAGGLQDGTKHALREKLLGHDASIKRFEIMVSEGPLKPEHANTLLNEVTIARQLIAAMNQPASRQLAAPSDAGGRTPQQLAGLSAPDRDLVRDLQKLIDTNLARLNQEADKSPKLQKSDAFSSINKTTEAVQQQFKQVMRESVPDELRGSFWKRNLSADDAREPIQQLLYKVSNIIKQNPEMRFAIDSGLAFPEKDTQTPDQARDRRAFMNDFVSTLRLNPNEKRDLVDKLIAQIDSGSIAPAELTLGRKLAAGGGGVLFDATLTKSHARPAQGAQGDDGLNAGYSSAPSNVVVKQLFATVLDPTDLIGALVETSTQARLAGNNPHVPRILGVSRAGDGTPSIAMQKMTGGNLEALLENNKVDEPALPAAERESRIKAHLYAFTGVVRGVAAMHAMDLVHNDIKPQNSMVDRDITEGMLIDFGATSKAGTASPADMTPIYAPPERMVPSSASHKNSDIWSLAVGLYQQMGFEAYSGFAPPGDADPVAARKQAIQDGMLPTDGAPASWTGMTAATDPLRFPIKIFIEACFNPDPDLRPTTAQIVQALNGERITLATDGAPGLRTADDVKKLGFFRPDHPLMAGGRDALALLTAQP